MSDSSEPMKPFWQQPSHPDVQEVQFAKEGFFSKSFSKVSLPPFGLFAKMSFPPCTKADKPTYATVQCGKNEHLNLNSDLVYINHSCEPSLIFDMPSRSIIAGAHGLAKGEELTFFYPSTEWRMAQGFDCFCGKASCKGYISGASQMSAKQLEGLWLNPWVRDGIEERDLEGEADAEGKSAVRVNGQSVNGRRNGEHADDEVLGRKGKLGAEVDGAEALAGASGRNGVTSRELSGEMGGDTVAV